MTHESVEFDTHAALELAADSLQMQQKGLPRGEPWQPGQSGNPAGRIVGSRNRAPKFAQALLDNDVEILVRQAIDRALKGDPVALKLCLERILAPRRQERVRFELPKLEKLEDPAKALAAVAAAVATGDLTPAEGRDLTALVQGFIRALVAHDFDRRLSAL